MNEQSKWIMILITVLVGILCFSVLLSSLFQQYSDIIISIMMFILPISCLIIIYKYRLFKKTHKWYIQVRIMTVVFVITFLGVSFILFGILISNINK